MNENLKMAAAEVLAAYREHQAMLLVAGHEPKQLNAAVDALEHELKAHRNAQAA